MLASGAFQPNFNQYPIQPNTCMNLRSIDQHNQPLLHPPQLSSPNCPRCTSTNTKFCYYNNYSLSQPRFFCKSCKRYWTRGGSLRNVPVGGGCRKTRRRSRRRSQSDTLDDNNSNTNPSSSSPSSDFNSTNRADIDLAAVFARYVNPDHNTNGVCVVSPPQDPSTTATATSTSSSWSSASDHTTRSHDPDDATGTNSPRIITNNDYLIQTAVADLLHNDVNLLPHTDERAINNTCMGVDCFWDIPQPSAPIECSVWSSSCQEYDASHRDQSTTNVELIASDWQLEQEFSLGMPPLMSTTGPGIEYSDIDDVWLELDKFNPSSTVGNDIDGRAGFDQLPGGM